METSALPVHVLERVLLTGDLSPLSSTERLRYYHKVCESLGLNPLTRPFEYIVLGNRLTLYCRRDGTDQLRRLHDISIEITSREFVNNLYVVCARAKFPSGRQDESIGAVSIAKLTGNDLANAIMKCESKAKRRCTLSLCGLGMSDESEVESIPNAHPWQEPMVQASPAPFLPAPAEDHATSLTSTSAPEPPVDPQPASSAITSGQLRLLVTIQKRSRVTDDQVHAHLQYSYGITSRKDVRQTDLNDVLQWLEERAAIADLEQSAA
jgi:hypothetical protein